MARGTALSVAVAAVRCLDMASSRADFGSITQGVPSEHGADLVQHADGIPMLLVPALVHDVHEGAAALCHRQAAVLIIPCARHAHEAVTIPPPGVFCRL